MDRSGKPRRLQLRHFLAVASNGVTQVGGTFADGTVFQPERAGVQRRAVAVLCVALHRTWFRVSVGWRLISSQPNSDVSGETSWIKPAIFHRQILSRRIQPTWPTRWDRCYTPPPGTTNRIRGDHQTALTGNSPAAICPLGSRTCVYVTADNKVTNVPANHQPAGVHIRETHRLFSGSVNIPGTTRYQLSRGAAFQNVNVPFGSGYFLGTNQSGSATLEAAPLNRFAVVCEKACPVETVVLPTFGARLKPTAITIFLAVPQPQRPIFAPL